MNSLISTFINSFMSHGSWPCSSLLMAHSWPRKGPAPPPGPGAHFGINQSASRPISQSSMNGIFNHKGPKKKENALLLFKYLCSPTDIHAWSMCVFG